MPAETAADGRADAFERERRRLTGIAYRMLGTMSDAEDVVQDAWLRWQGAPADDIRQPSAYLSTIVTRLSLDRLKEARRRREIYVGPWLPEPVLADPALSEAPAEAIDRDVSFALMLALERLSPLERAAFVLHDVFDVPFGEIAPLLQRSEQTCRQLASRARASIRRERPRFAAAPEDVETVAEAFFAASRSGDLGALRQILADGATLRTDGGGRERAARNVIAGADKVARFFAGLARKPTAAPPRWSRRARVNGLPALLTVEADGVRQVTLVETEGGQVSAVYVIRNPEKLERLWAAAETSGAIGDAEAVSV